MQTGSRVVPHLLKPVIGHQNVLALMKSLPVNTAMFTYPLDFRGVGRHCMLTYKGNGGQVVMWDPSPTYDKEAECPLRTTYNETALNIRAYAEGRLLSWTKIEKKQSDKNMNRRLRRRWRKRQRTGSWSQHVADKEDGAKDAVDK
jgi:hypothetical protein